jgi:hypothetical protein
MFRQSGPVEIHKDRFEAVFPTMNIIQGDSPIDEPLVPLFTSDRENASCPYNPSNSAVISLADSFLRIKNRAIAAAPSQAKTLEH